MVLYLSADRNPLAAQYLQRSLRASGDSENENIFRRNLLNNVFSWYGCLFFVSKPACSPAGPQKPSGFDYFGKKIFVQPQIKENVHGVKAPMGVINCV